MLDLKQEYESVDLVYYILNRESINNFQLFENAIYVFCYFSDKLKETLETVLDDSLIRFLNRRELDFRWHS